MNSTAPFNFNTNMAMPLTSPAPLHDIIGPVSFFPYTTGQVALGLALLLLMGAGLAWGIWKWRQPPALSRQELLLQALAAMKENLMSGSDHDFGISVSGLLRNYLSDVFGFAAPRQTTEEFLNSLRFHKKFTSPEQDALCDFLKQSDVLKFAQGKLEEQERLALIIAAEQFVQSGMGEESDSAQKAKKKEVSHE